MDTTDSTLLAVRMTEPQVASVTASPCTPALPAAIMTTTLGTLALRLAHGERKIEG